MKKIFAIGLAGILSAAGLFAEQVLNGAGASFPAPVYQAWSSVIRRLPEGFG